MRLAVFSGLLCVFAVTGCYNPNVQSGGFACSATDNPPCPDGFHCVNGLCVDHGGMGGGGGGGGGGTVIDMSLPTGDVDMSLPSAVDMTQAPADLAHAPPDLACRDFPYDCGGDPTCCSQCCVGGCSAVGICALF